MKLVFITILIIAASGLVCAQEKEDSEEKGSKMGSTDKLKRSIESPKIINDSLRGELYYRLNVDKSEYSMLTKKPDMNKVVPMPKMDIDTSTNYTIQIKKYDLFMSSPPNWLKNDPDIYKELTSPK